MQDDLFIEVILPVPLADTYTYSVPKELQAQIQPGSLVLVEFGKNKHYSGVIASIHQIKPISTFEIKPILSLESNQPVLRRPQIRFWEWLSQYYICKLGEIFKAVIPNGLRIESSNPYFSKKETYIRLNKIYYENETLLSEVFNSLKRAPKQEKLLLSYINYSNCFSSQKHTEVSRNILLKKSDSTGNILNELINKGILESYEKEVSRLDFQIHETKPINTLNTFQDRKSVV